VRNVSSLAKKLNSIPHLPIPVSYDAKKIEAEIRTMPIKLEGYQSTLQSNHSEVSSRWNNLSLYSYNGEYVCDRLEGAGPGELERILNQFKRTELYKHLPYTYSVIDSLGAGNALCRIEEILPQGQIGWHNHVYELYHPETMMIIQVPISIPENFTYAVMSNRDFLLSDFSQDTVKIHNLRYEPGTPYSFNAYHYHAVFNGSGKEKRLTIRFFADIRDNKFYDLMEKAVDEYKGEYLD
jgi:hypothetical protein